MKIKKLKNRKTIAKIAALGSGVVIGVTNGLVIGAAVNSMTHLPLIERKVLYVVGCIGGAFLSLPASDMMAKTLTDWAYKDVSDGE